MKNLTETELLGKLQNRDEMTFSLLYKFYFPMVKSFTCKNSGNNAYAEDVFQESIIVLFQI